MNLLRMALAAGAAAALSIAACSSSQKADSSEAANIRADVGGPIFTVDKLPRSHSGHFGIQLTAEQWKLTQKYMKAEPAPKDASEMPYALMITPMPDGGAMMRTKCPGNCKPKAVPGGPMPDLGGDFGDPTINPITEESVSFSCADCDFGPGGSGPIGLTACRLVFVPTEITIGGQTVRFLLLACRNNNCQSTCVRVRAAQTGATQLIGCECR